MTPIQRNKFFPAHSLASRDWINVTAGQQPIETWLSGSISLRRSVDLESVLSMADRFGIRAEVIADRLESLQDPERLFVRDATTQMADEVSMAAFLLRAGRGCAIQLTASATLERLLESVFQEYLASVSDKMANWKVPGTVNAAGGPQLAQDAL